MSRSKVVLRSRRVVLPQGVRPACVVLEQGRIAEITDYASFVPGLGCEDLGSDALLPGGVDPHVHVNQPGRTHWEGFRSATRAAAAGGFTLIGDMPLNSSPVTVDRRSLLAKSRSAWGLMQVDCAFYGGLIAGGAGKIPQLIREGVPAVKAFLVDSGLEEFPPASEEDLRQALPDLAEAGVPLLVHAELPGRGSASSGRIEHPRRYRAYLESRPEEWEVRAVRLLIRLCREFACRIHIVHLSSVRVVPLLRRARAEGLGLTVETCPHYLTFASEEIADGDTRFKCAPPIRSGENRERLWAALGAGDIDFVASDHSPCPPRMKHLEEGDFAAAWGGIASLELGISALWTEARRRGHDLSDLARWTATGPAVLLGLGRCKGVIEEGFDADLTVFDPDEEWTARGGELHHRHPIIPYEGRRLRGRVRRTYLRGRPVFNRGEFGPPQGRELRFSAGSRRCRPR